jgi:hypothetical protein
MSERPISPTLLRLIEAARDLARRARTCDTDVEARNVAEAGAECAFKLAYAVAFEAAEGSTRAREIRADVVTIELLRAWKTATALRRSATEAAKTIHHEMDALGAISNCANREIKAEMQMGGYA